MKEEDYFEFHYLYYFLILALSAIKVFIDVFHENFNFSTIICLPIIVLDLIGLIKLSIENHKMNKREGF